MHIVENRFKFLAISICVMLVGIIFMIVNGVSGRGPFSLDVEFSGGTSFTIDMGTNTVDDTVLTDITSIVKSVTGQEAPQVQKAGNSGTTNDQVMIRMQSVEQSVRENLINQLSTKYGLDNSAFTYTDISPTVSGDMQRSAILAVIVACIAMLIYVSIRFKDWRMGLSSILALLHDSFIMIAFYAILRIPLNYSFIAAILTILGYSINSTIVIFDRMRENKPVMRKAPQAELINTSIMQTMRRSIFTSLTVFITVLILYILGVASIKQFTLPLMIGVVSGAYSSVCLAGSFWYMFSKKPAHVGSAQGVAAASKAPAVKAAVTDNSSKPNIAIASSASVNGTQVIGNGSSAPQSTPRKKKKKHR